MGLTFAPSLTKNSTLVFYIHLLICFASHSFVHSVSFDLRKPEQYAHHITLHVLGWWNRIDNRWNLLFNWWCIIKWPHHNGPLWHSKSSSTFLSNIRAIWSPFVLPMSICNESHFVNCFRIRVSLYQRFNSSNWRLISMIHIFYAIWFIGYEQVSNQKKKIILKTLIRSNL